MSVPERLLAIHKSLSDAEVEHAFGGAIALAFWTTDPRGTQDIDINIFVPPDDCESVLAVLPEEISYADKHVAAIKRDGQVRLLWAETPVDLFFHNVPIHEEARRHVRQVEFAGERIPILGPAELAVFKAMFDRTQDWADIEKMLAAKTIDPDVLRERLEELLGPGDHRIARVDDALAQVNRAERPWPGGTGA